MAMGATDTNCAGGEAVICWHTVFDPCLGAFVYGLLVTQPTGFESRQQCGSFSLATRPRSNLWQHCTVMVGLGMD